MNSYKTRLKEMYPAAWRWVSVARRIPGWLTDAEANALFEIARSRDSSADVVIVELGSWHGKSSVLLAAGLCSQASARLYCIDPFGQDENPVFQAREYDPLLRRMPYSLEEGFKRTIRRCGVAHVVEAVKGYSYDVVRTWERAIDVLFIDASHHYEAVQRDFQLWSAFVKPGGIVALHDVSPSYPGPSRVMAEDLQPPGYAELQQVDSLAWAVKKHIENGSAPHRPRTLVTIPKVDFDARLWELDRLSRIVAERNGPPGAHVLSPFEADHGRLIAQTQWALGKVGAMQFEVSRLTDELIKEATRGGCLTAQLSASTEQAAHLQAELDRTRSAAVEVQRDVFAAGERRDAEIVRLRVEAAAQVRKDVSAAGERHNAEIVRLRAEAAAQAQASAASLRRLEREAVVKDERIYAFDRELKDAAGRMQVQEFGLSRAAQEIQEARDALKALHRSGSWRITLPLRAILEAWLFMRRLVGGDGRDTALRGKVLGWIQWMWYGKLVRDSGLFDRQYYLERNQDVAESRVDPLRHFFIFGACELRNPHPLFDLHYYFTRYRDVAASNVNPLAHYLKWGAAEGRNPHPNFDTNYYLRRNPEVSKMGLNPLAHFMGPGAAQGLSPSPWFDTIEYLENNPHVAIQGLNPLVHHLTHRNAGLQAVRRARDNSTQAPAASSSRAPLPPGMQIDPRTTELRASMRAKHQSAGLPPLNGEYHAEPVVSVIIPCYNYGYYLEDALISAMMASSYPMEIVVVDDGSTDEGSIAAVQELAERYHFRLLRQSNTGQSGARYNGIRNSRGKFIQFLDADDLLAPGKIDAQVDMMMRDEGIDIAVCEYELCDADGNGRRTMKPSTLAGFHFSAEDFLLRWERGFSLPIHCALVRRRVLDRSQFQCITKAGKEDWIFWVVVAAASPRFVFHPDVMATYRIHGHNHFTNREGMGLDYLRASMYVLQSGLNSCDNFLEESILHFQKAYLGSIKHEAIVRSRSHDSE